MFRLIACIIVSILILISTIYAEEMAITESGKRVILNDDGTWRYEKDTNPSIPEEVNKAATHEAASEIQWKISNGDFRECKDYAMSQFREYNLTKADKANGVLNSWCANVEFICYNNSDKKWLSINSVIYIVKNKNGISSKHAWGHGGHCR